MENHIPNIVLGDCWKTLQNNILFKSREYKRNKTMTSLPSDRLTADCFVSSLCHSSWKTYRDLVFHQLLSFLHTKHFSHPHIKYNSLLAPFLARIMTLSRPHWHAVGRQSADSRPTGGRQSTDWRPTVVLSTDCRSTVGRLSVRKYRPTVRMSTDSRVGDRPTGG